MKRIKRQAPAFKTEAELCAAFSAECRRLGYKVYPEHEDWDVVVVDKDGNQLGVQAKLKANVTVLYQALRGMTRRSKPKFGAVLVGESVGGYNEFNTVTRFLGLQLYEPERRCNGAEGWRFPRLEKFGLRTPTSGDRFSDGEPLWLPHVEVDMPGGAPAPRRITKWKLAAVAMCLKLRKQGYIEAYDFTDAGISMGRWVKMWLQGIKDPRGGRKKVYVAKPGVKLPDELYPEVAEVLTKQAESATIRGDDTAAEPDKGDAASTA